MELNFLALLYLCVEQGLINSFRVTKERIYITIKK